jgi:hypothetical protein
VKIVCDGVCRGHLCTLPYRRVYTLEKSMVNAMNPTGQELLIGGKCSKSSISFTAYARNIIIKYFILPAYVDFLWMTSINLFL